MRIGMALSIHEINQFSCEQNPFAWESFKRCWFEHLAGKYQVSERYGDFVVHRKHVAGGLLTVRELKFYAGYTAWFHDFDDAALKTFLDLQQDVAWDYFYTVWAGEREHLQAFQELEKAGFPLLHGSAIPMHMADLSGGFEAYMDRHNANDRRHLRLKMRAAEKAKPQLVRCERAKDIERFFEEFFRWHVPYWQQKTGYSFFTDSRERQFTIAWAKALHEAGVLRLHELRLHGKPANLSFSFVCGNTMYWPLTINTGTSVSHLYPGIVSLHMRIEDACREGLSSFNMGCGALQYKLQAQTHTNPRNVLVVINPRSLKGRLFEQWFRRRNPQQKIVSP